MADQVLTKQKLIDANEDVQALEDVVNGEPGKLVKTRLGREVYTLASVPQINTMTREEVAAAVAPKANKADVDEALSNLSTNANKFYPTLAEANYYITQMAVNDVVTVGEEANKGLWYKATAGAMSLTKSAYDPLTQAKNYTDLELGKIAYTYSKNKYDPSKAVSDRRISGGGTLNTVAGAKHTGHIPVEAGKQYTMSWSNTVPDIAYYSFFANSTDQSNPIEYSTSGSTASPRTFTVPAGAKYVVINLKHDSTATERANFQLEEGATATAYDPYTPTAKAQPSFLDDAVKKDELADLVEPLLVKDYEINAVSKNLFNEDDLLVDLFLSTVSGGLNPSAGWLCSGFIPVEAGKQYTLSGVRARQGLSFFATNDVVSGPALLCDNTPTLPLTVTAPEGANFAVIALESSTAKGYSNIQFEEGSQATAYIPYGYTEQLLDGSKVTEITLDQISDLDSLKPNTKANLSLINGSGSVKSGDLEIGLRVFNPINYDGSAVFKFYEDKYKGDVVRINGDDVAPVRMMGATVGANHGYSRTILTLTNHGKTNADVGSVWTNGTTEWVVIQIISANQLAVTCRTLNIEFPPGNTLTHVSGAANTASFTPTATSARQWYPMLKNHKVNLSLDDQNNNDVNLDSGFNDSLKISESYDLMEKSDIVEWLILNGGKEVTNYSAASACNVSHTHTFNSDLTDTISANFFVYKDLSAARDLMFTQSAPLEPVDNELLYYVPRSIPFTHKSIAYDFSKLQNVADLNITARIDFTSARTEVDAVLPDRLVMLAGDLGYASGYLPILDAAPDVRNTLTSKGIQISQARDSLDRPSAKLYPYLIDGLTALQAGANYSCVAYRAYFNRPGVAARTVQYDVQHGNEVYLFLDWHSGDFVDTVELKPYLQGRSFEVIEKTDNVTLLCKVASENIAVKVGTVTGNARLILKFK